MRSMFCCLRLPISSVQAAWRLICPGFSAALKAAKADLMSPTTGAAIARLLSISVGEMSTWTKRAFSFHSGAPAVRQQPVEARPGHQHDIGVADRIGAGGGGRLRMVVGQAGPWPSTSAGTACRWSRETRGSRLRPAHRPRPCRGSPAAAAPRPAGRGRAPTASGAGDARRRRIDDLDQRFPAGLGVERRSPAPRRSGRDRRRPAGPETAARIARAMPMPISCGRLTR